MLISIVTGNGFTKRSSFSRALSLLLLVFILWGTTIEAAHRHGSIVIKQETGSSSLFDARQANTRGSNLTGCGDCLICQLQHNFSTSLIVFQSSQTTLPLRTRYSET